MEKGTKSGRGGGLARDGDEAGCQAEIGSRSPVICGGNIGHERDVKVRVTLWHGDKARGIGEVNARCREKRGSEETAVDAPGPGCSVKSESDTSWGSAMGSEVSGPSLVALRGRLPDVDALESTLLVVSTVSSTSGRFRLRGAPDV